MHVGTAQPGCMDESQSYSTRMTADLPNFGATLEQLALLLREAFHDSLGRATPDLASSQDLVLDMHAAAERLLVDCSLPAHLVPSLAEALILSTAVTTALAAACQQLGRPQFGYTLQLNNQTALVKKLSTAEASLCPVKDGCVPSIARVTLATHGLCDAPVLEISVTDINSSSCSFVAKLPGQFEAVKLDTVAEDMQLGQYLVSCPDSVRACQGSFQVEAQQGNLRGESYTIDSFQSLEAMQSRAVPGNSCAIILCCAVLCFAVLGCDGTAQHRAPKRVSEFMWHCCVPAGHAGSQAHPCVPVTQTCSVCQSGQVASTSMATQTWVCAGCQSSRRPAAQVRPL